MLFSSLSYGKVLNFGHKQLKELLYEPVCVQEKVDGSQFSFWFDEDKGSIIFKSKNTILGCDVGTNALFDPAISAILEMNLDIDRMIKEEIIFRGECVSKLKHNSIKYERTPKNYVIIFDVEKNGKVLSHKEAKNISEEFGFEFVPVYYEGYLKEKELSKFLNEKSCLGNSVSIEGIVVKRIDCNLFIHLFKNITEKEASPEDLFLFMPARMKLVSKDFRELNDNNWKIEKKDSMYERIGQKYCSMQRWKKVIQHGLEDNKLTLTPKDIGYLIPKIIDDVIEEEIDNIKEDLYDASIKRIKGYFIKGFPEWYKEHARDFEND